MYHDDFIQDAGYNRWAASNDIVVLYPQATASSQTRTLLGFLGLHWIELSARTGTQMRAVKAMVDRLLGQ